MRQAFDLSGLLAPEDVSGSLDALSEARLDGTHYVLRAVNLKLPVEDGVNYPTLVVHASISRP